MLPSHNRIPTSRITHVLRFGKRVRNEALQLAVAKGEGDVSRFAFVVSTKVDKRATHRNRTRRLLSEAIRMHMKNIVPGFDCVLVAKQDMYAMGQSDVESLVRPLLVQSAVMRPE
jgi:ribonuclease P protein component